MGTFTGSMIRHFTLPFWTWRDHPRMRSYLREFEGTQFISRSALQALQLRRVQKLLDHAYQHCPFYRDRMTQVGFDPAGLQSLDDLKALPLLTKRDIQNHGSELLAENYAAESRVRNQTGGSTGSPLQFYVDRERFDSRLASTTRHNQWAGLYLGEWCAELWGARLDLMTQEGWWDWCRNIFLYRLVQLNTSRIQPEDWEPFMARLRKKRIRFLVTYTQSAVLFARYLREKGIDDIRFQSIITTAEVLLPGQREILEEAFQARVFNRYGCRELSVIASECEHHRGMHVNAEALLVEIVPDPAYPLPMGKIVITDLLNYSMPFIRYEIGDVGHWADTQECPCGRGLPLLADVQGRITDFLILPDGTHISGPSLTLVVADMADVAQVQFVQRGPQSVGLRVVPGKNYGPQTRDELRRRISLYLAGLADLSIEEVTSIASEASGKYRFVVNEMEAKPLAEASTRGGQA